MAIRMITAALLVFAAFGPSAHADLIDELRLDVSATFSRIEQQAKREVGAARGERLVEQTELGTELILSTTIWGPLSGGIFAHADIGTRRAGRFDGFDADGATVLVGIVWIPRRR